MNAGAIPRGAGIAYPRRRVAPLASDGGRKIGADAAPLGKAAGADAGDFRDVTSAGLRAAVEARGFVVDLPGAPCARR